MSHVLGRKARHCSPPATLSAISLQARSPAPHSQWDGWAGPARTAPLQDHRSCPGQPRRYDLLRGSAPPTISPCTTLQREPKPGCVCGCQFCCIALHFFLQRIKPFME